MVPNPINIIFIFCLIRIMNKNFVFYKKKKVLGRSRRLFKHIKNNKIYIIENKEYVPLTKYLKKKYVGGMFNNNVDLTRKIKLLYSMYKIIYVINNYITTTPTESNSVFNQNIKKFLEDFEFYFKKSHHEFKTINVNSNVEYIKFISNKFLKYIKSVIKSIDLNINKYGVITRDYILNLKLFKKNYLLPFESILNKDISSFKPKYVVIKAPPRFELDNLGVVKFHSLYFDDKLGLSYVRFYDNSNKLMSISIEYVYNADDMYMYQGKYMYQDKPIETIFVGGKKSKK